MIHNKIAGLMHVIFSSLYLKEFDINHEAALSINTCLLIISFCKEAFR
jgi:hypothetical protein